MGIQGLLPLLREASRNVHLESLKGLTIGVDGYVWLHRAAYGCAGDLALGKPTRRYVDYCVDQVKRLQSFGIKPYIVFDGGPLPAKKGTEIERRQKREESRTKGLELWHAGQKTEAFDYFAASIDVSPTMAFEVIKALRRMDVPYVVAPYEADAQLAYLEKKGIIDGILTEDSDLLVFGCKRVFYKLDKDSIVQEIHRTRFCEVRGEIVLGGKFTDDKFRWMCILSGCDYLPSIPNLGLKKAYKLLVRCSSVVMALRTGSFSYKFTIPKDYLDEFQKADNTFLYQRVWDPELRKLVTLNTPPAGFDVDAATYLGPYLPDEVAAAIATGDLDPVRRTVLGTVSDEVLALLAHLPVNAPARKQTVDAKPAAPVLVLGSDDDQVDGAAGKPDSQAEAAVSKAFENRVLKQITAQKVVDTRTRSPFFAKPATVAEPSESNLALEPVKAAQVANVAANPVDKPRRVITLKRINDENSPDPAPIIHAKVEKEPTTLSVVREEPEALPEASPPIALLDVEESTKQVAESGRESASQKVFHGMLNKYRLAQPSVPIPAPAPRAVPKPKLGDHLEAFSRSFPAYDFVHKPLEAVSGRQTVVDLDDDPDSPEEGGRSASSQPILPTQSAVTKRKRMSNPLPRPASQPQRTKKKIFLTNQPQLTSGWFSGWSPADRDEDEP